MGGKIIRNSTISVVVIALFATGCATPRGGDRQASGGASDQCNLGIAALAGAAVGGLLAQGNNRVRGAALGAGLASLACVAWNYNVKQTKTAEQVQTEYKAANLGQLPERSKVTRYETRFDPSAKVPPGGKLTVVSNIEVVQGAKDQKPLLEEELTLVRPDGSEVKSRKKANENQGAGAYMTSYSMTMPTGVPQGVYPVKTALFMNGEKVASKDMSMQVVSIPSGEMVAFAR
jgi:hypothetical protein